MYSTQRKADLSFKEGILRVRFTEGAVVEVEDVIYIYCYGMERSKTRPYGILFDTSSRHEFTEDAIIHFTESHYLDNIIAIAYISRDLISKIRLNLLMIFERPRVKPKIFGNEKEAIEWLQKQVSQEVIAS